MYSLVLPLLLAADVSKPLSVANQIDAAMTKHWQSAGVQPAPLCEDSTFLRRVTLDLVGRIPTVAEAKAFLADTTVDKRRKAVERLMQSPEYALHTGRVLDDIVQDKFAGDGEFLEYLRNAVTKRKAWDVVFREVMLGPWDDADRKGASAFLTRRVRSLDDLTTDTSRVFFGVNVSCAQCHDHPLVSDWKQDHYYGMASFFNRTSGKGGGKGQTGSVEEKASGEVMFNTTKGERKTAKMMFLSSKIIDEEQIKKTSKTPFSRREQLVTVALAEKTFFSKAIVNQLWAFYMGRGLVHPVDQMHSANAASVPGLLEQLADDLANNGYNIHRLIEGIVTSRVYQQASIRPQGGKAPGDNALALADLRPLTPQQFGVSLTLATGDLDLDSAKDAKAREDMARELEKRASSLVKAKVFDARTDRYQTSTGEALFVSNHPDIRKLVEPSKTNLVGRLAAMVDTKQIVETAVWTVLSRPSDPEETAYLTRWVESKPDRAKGCGQLVWALMSSAEFRFNH